MRTKFDEQLALLNKELIQMASMCEEAIALSAKSLLEGDTELAKRVLPVDSEIEQLAVNMKRLQEKYRAAKGENRLFQLKRLEQDINDLNEMIRMVTDDLG